MALSVLGPLLIDGDHGPVHLSGRKAREVLTLLVLASPRPMSVHDLAEAIWDEPPPAAVKTVQGHLSRLRGTLASARPPAGTLSGGPAGYRFVAAPDLVDVARVESLRRQARRASLEDDHSAVVDLLASARQLWRGMPELPSTLAGDLERTRLTEARLHLVEDHLEAVVRAGRSLEAVPELEALARRHPLRERIQALHIEALYRSGRRAEALAGCRAVRARLRDEAGLDPGRELLTLERAVFREELPALPAAAAPAPFSRPALLYDGPRYAAVDNGYVAYGRLRPAEGPATADLLLLNPTFVPVDSLLEEPHLVRALTALAGNRRLLAYDRRGLGLSDPVAPEHALGLRAWVDDAIAVLDAEGVERVDVFANADTTMVALLLAATFPGRVRRLCLVNPYPRFTRSPEYPHGLPAVETAARLDAIHTPVPTAPAVDVLTWRLPAVAGDQAFRRWWDAVGRRGASPRSAAVVHQLILGSDVRAALERITAPTLLLSRLGCASYDPDHARFLASRLEHATLAERRDANDAWFVGDVEWIAHQVQQFLAASEQ